MPTVGLRGFFLTRHFELSIVMMFAFVFSGINVDFFIATRVIKVNRH